MTAPEYFFLFLVLAAFLLPLVLWSGVAYGVWALALSI